MATHELNEETSKSMIMTMVQESFKTAEIKDAFRDMMRTIFAEELEARFSALETRVAALEAKLLTQENKLQNQIVSTRQQSIMSENGKMNNLVVSGIAESPEENPAELVSKLASATSTKLGGFTATRVGKPKSDKGRPILVVCESHWDKRKLYDTRTTLKDHGYENVYINEDLTPKQSELFFHARKAKNQKLIHTTWTDNGAISIRTRQGVQAIKVSSIEALKSLVPDYNMPS